MDLDKRVGTFTRAGVGLATAFISLASCILTIVLLMNLKSDVSFTIFAIILSILLMALWFARLSYLLLFQATEKRQPLLSPFSIIVIFGILGLGILAGTIFRFVTGDMEKGFLGVLLLFMLLSLGHYCWKRALVYS